MAKSMIFKKIKPMINIIKRVYEKGVTLCKAAMNAFEKRLYHIQDVKK